MIRDPALKASDVRVAGLIIPWLGKGETASVPVPHLARGAVIGTRAVRVCLDRLREGLWFACKPSRGNPTGRLFVALWRTEGGFLNLVNRLGDTLDMPPAAFTEAGLSTFGLMEKGTVEPPRYKPNESTILTQRACHNPGGVPMMTPEDDRAGATTTAPPVNSLGGGAGEGETWADDETRVLFERAASGIRTVACLPDRVPGIDSAIALAARLIANALIDHHSAAFHRRVLKRMRRGEFDADRVIGTLRFALMRPPGSIENVAAYYKTLLVDEGRSHRVA